MTQLCNGAEYFAEKEDLLAFLFSVLRQHAHNRLVMAGDFNFLPSEALAQTTITFLFRSFCMEWIRHPSPVFGDPS
jgi:hypothetical protein